MDNSNINNRFFQRLIERYLDGLITADELKLLVNYYESFQKENEWVEALGPENVIKKRMLKNILEAIKEDETKNNKVFKIFKSNLFKYSAAASILIGLLSIVYLQVNSAPEENEIETPIIVNNNIENGTKKAILTLEDGNKIAIKRGDVLETDNATSDGEKITYNKNEDLLEKVAYNTLTVPRGGNFNVILSDGTEVWLNSESQLKFPVSFEKGKPRKVDLLYGEAYFDVSPSAKHNGSQFVVANNNHVIEVLGTAFNLKSYKEEENIITTLVHGKIRVNYKEQNFSLLPDQQSIINIKSDRFTISTVDSDYYTSWKTGEFKFDNSSLKEILTVLSRWYDFEFEFKNKKLEDEKFMGSLGKNQDITDILYNIKNFGIITNFKIENKTLTIE